MLQTLARHPQPEDDSRPPNGRQEHTKLLRAKLQEKTGEALVTDNEGFLASALLDVMDAAVSLYTRTTGMGPDAIIGSLKVRLQNETDYLNAHIVEVSD